MWPRGSQVDLPQFRSSISGSFGPHFGRLSGLTRRQTMKSVSDVLLASIFDEKLMDCGAKLELSEDDTFLEVLKCAKWIFEQHFMYFNGFYVSREYVDPWFWKQK